MRLIRVTTAALLLTATLAVPVLAGQPIAADLSVVKTDSPDPVAAGSNITYTITVQNAGPSTSQFMSLLDTIPTGTTFVSVIAPVGWIIDSTPPVGGTGSVLLLNESLTVAAGAQVITLVVQVDPATPNGTVISNTATVASETNDPNEGNDSATVMTTVGPPPPTPAASLADAAMPVPGSGSPLVILGFTALLVATLGATAVLATRRVRP